MKTNLDLYLSATAVAIQSLELKNQHELHTASLETFNDEKQDPEDYNFWHATFINQRATFLGLKQQPAQSETARKEREAAEALKPQTAPAAPAPAPATKAK